MTIVEFFYDIISPFSRIQYDLLMRQIPHWKSMQLKMTPVSIRKIFEAAENTPPGLNPTKAAYLFGDLRTISEFHKIPFKLPEDFMQIAMERGTLKTQRFLAAIQDDLDEATYHGLVGKLFLHFFHPTEFVNITGIPECKQLAAQHGISQSIIDKAAEAVDKEETKEKLKKNIDRCVELGAFGLPVTLVQGKDGDSKWVFGSDRMHIIGYWLGEKQPPILRPE